MADKEATARIKINKLDQTNIVLHPAHSDGLLDESAKHRYGYFLHCLLLPEQPTLMFSSLASLRSGNYNVSHRHQLCVISGSVL